MGKSYKDLRKWGKYKDNKKSKKQKGHKSLDERDSTTDTEEKIDYANESITT